MGKPAVFIQKLSGRGSGETLPIWFYYNVTEVGLSVDSPDDHNVLSLRETLLASCLRRPVRKVDFPLQSPAAFYNKSEK